VRYVTFLNSWFITSHIYLLCFRFERCRRECRGEFRIAEVKHVMMFLYSLFVIHNLVYLHHCRLERCTRMWRGEFRIAMVKLVMMVFNRHSLFVIHKSRSMSFREMYADVEGRIQNS